MYSCILMDPPWQERGGGKIKRGADKHYPLVPTRNLPFLILGSGVFKPAENCHLWVWATNNHLTDALWLIDALGFRYITNAVWVKDRMGLGQYLRGQHELLLLGVQGSGPAVRTPARNLPSVVSAKREAHSAKPESAYKLIEARTVGPRLEMFARNARPGWDCWGNEVDETGPDETAGTGGGSPSSETGCTGRRECSPSYPSYYEWGGPGYE